MFRLGPIGISYFGGLRVYLYLGKHLRFRII